MAAIREGGRFVQTQAMKGLMDVREFVEIRDYENRFFSQFHVCFLTRYCPCLASLYMIRYKCVPTTTACDYR